MAELEKRQLLKELWTALACSRDVWARSHTAWQGCGL